VSWELFEREAERYEAWYETARGSRASRAETALLDGLLDAFGGARTVLDVGCGTGHFARWFAQRGFHAIGLDRAPAMLAILRQQLPACPALIADAHLLPLRDRAVDLVVFVTTLEFLDDPRRALAETVRVARRGLIVLALNRWSAGALSRRFGPASRGALLPHARDLSPPELRRLMGEAAGKRLGRLRCRSALLPPPLPAGPMRIWVGDIVGVAAELRSA
jgi:ubiquinone/menaquinone biosynthesis C-methylase UbiE